MRQLNPHLERITERCISEARGQGTGMSILPLVINDPVPPSRRHSQTIPLTPTELAQSVWLSSRDAARYLRTSVGGLRNMVYRGQLLCYKRQRKLLFKRSDLDRYVETSRRGAYK